MIIVIIVIVIIKIQASNKNPWQNGDDESVTVYVYT